MNARAEIVDDKLEYIPLSAIAPSETHIQQLRRKRYDMESLADLRASIAKLGVQQPGVVRKLTALRGLASYELVAGERRYRAAGQAGLITFPAIVRELTDEAVLEIQLVENLQREDLHPLEEAAGYEELMKVGKLKPEQLGERVGKSRSWVYSRLNLLKLPKEAQDALQDGRLDVSRALMVASVAQPNQRNQVMQMAVERDGNNNFRYSIRQLRAEVVKERLTFPLHGAPFPTDDATLLPSAGDCGGCQYRAGNCDPEALDPDVCTNVACYHLKVKAQADRRRADAKTKGIKVLTGDAARKVSPSVKTVYGHVDLDLVCEHDEFPEPAPKDLDEYADEDRSHPAMLAWRSREEAWRPRTYRELLAGQKYESVLIEDPKTKALRELVLFKVAQLLLKKAAKIDLPSYANRKRHEFQRSGGGKSAEEREKEEAKGKAQEARKEAEREIEAEARRRILKEAFPKVKATLDKDTLLHLVDRADAAGAAMLVLLFGHKDLRKLKEADLIRLILSQEAIWATENAWRQPQDLNKLAAAVKVNADAIRKAVRKERAEAAEK